MPENEDHHALEPVRPAGRALAPQGGEVALGGQSMAEAFEALFANSVDVVDDVSDEGARHIAEEFNRRQVRLAALEPAPEPERDVRCAMPVAAANDMGNPVVVADGARVDWGSIANLSSYMVNVVRSQGREIFRSFPCYAALERELAPRGRDALAELRMLANVAGHGPHDQVEIDRVARWIRDNGHPVDARTLTLPRVPGYNPRIILACDDDHSFLLVSEPAFRGQAASTYIYGWEGGMRFYRERLGAGDDLKAFMANRRLPPGVGGVPVAALPAPASAARAEPAGIVVDATAARAEGARRSRQRPAPAAPGPATSLAAAFMDIGFSRRGTAAGPVLTRGTDSGGTATLASAEEGVPLHKAGSLRLVVRDEAGELVDEAVLGSVDELEAAVAPSGPKP